MVSLIRSRTRIEVYAYIGQSQKIVPVRIQHSTVYTMLYICVILQVGMCLWGYVHIGLHVCEIVFYNNGMNCSLCVVMLGWVVTFSHTWARKDSGWCCRRCYPWTTWVALYYVCLFVCVHMHACVCVVRVTKYILTLMYIHAYVRRKSSLFTTEVVEHACSITTLQLGETLGGVSKDMDTYTYRTPLGVCAGITPWVSKTL